MSRKVVLLLVLVFLIGSSAMAFQSVSVVSADSWSSKAPMKVARANLGVGVVNGKIYAIGGFVENGSTTGTNEEYDPITDTWAFKAPMPTPRAYFAIAVYENKIYCIGEGANEVYDPATDTWENKTSMPTARIALDANVVRGKIYLIGGFIPDDGGSGGIRVTVNEVYDPTTDSWTTAVPMPNLAFDYNSAVCDNEIYFIDESSDNPPYLLHQIYHPETDTWSEGAFPPSSTIGGAAAATTGVNALKRIYVFGSTRNLWKSELSFNVRLYNSDSNEWAFGANMLTKRQGFAVAVVNDMLYIIGGSTIKYVSVDKQVETDDVHGDTFCAINEQYKPFGYGMLDPSYDGTAPEVTVASPENRTYYATEVELNFTVNEPVSSMHYALDGESAVEISENITLAGLFHGEHNLTVYVVDFAGNKGVSEIVCFTVAEATEPFPVVTVAVVSTAVAVLIGVSLAVYFVKTRKNQNRFQNTTSEQSS
jgi:N-acetylneuraminic acid mutarotase